MEKNNKMSNYDIGVILTEALFNAVVNNAEDTNLDKITEGAALERITRSLNYAKEQGVFSEEEHENNLMAVGVFGISLLKRYPELIPDIRQYIKEKGNDSYDTKFN